MLALKGCTASFTLDCQLTCLNEELSAANPNRNSFIYRDATGKHYISIVLKALHRQAKITNERSCGEGIGQP
jgi:hypothetical protein